MTTFYGVPTFGEMPYKMTQFQLWKKKKESTLLNENTFKNKFYFPWKVIGSNDKAQAEFVQNTEVRQFQDDHICY